MSHFDLKSLPFSKLVNKWKQLVSRIFFSCCKAVYLQRWLNCETKKDVGITQQPQIKLIVKLFVRDLGTSHENTP